ncbi:MAG: hypothetical protein AAB354_16870 [candidate division KSB1 bacterium]
MIVLTCALCEKSSNYSAEELVGRYFMCKHCHWLNLSETSGGAYAETLQQNLPHAAFALANGKQPDAALGERPK